MDAEREREKERERMKERKLCETTVSPFSHSPNYGSARAALQEGSRAILNKGYFFARTWFANVDPKDIHPCSSF